MVLFVFQFYPVGNFGKFKDLFIFDQLIQSGFVSSCAIENDVYEWFWLVVCVLL